MMEKYEAPSLTTVGTLRDLTLEGTTGDFTDDDFPANTPRGNLTFTPTPR